jgi:GNAT superfamily N-acetyltransferase
MSRRRTQRSSSPSRTGGSWERRGLTSHGSLERLYVLAETRGSGAGSALLAAVVAEARQSGHTELEIWSDKRFIDAHRLYERYGARVVGERVHDDPDDSHEWGLVLDLTNPPERT